MAQTATELEGGCLWAGVHSNITVGLAWIDLQARVLERVLFQEYGERSKDADSVTGTGTRKD